MDGHGDDMKDSNLSQGACVCEDEDTTTYLRECARRSVDVVAGVRIAKSTQAQTVSLTFVSWSVTQAYMSSLPFMLCFVTHS